MKRIRILGLLYENNDENDQEQKEDHAVGNSQFNSRARRSTCEREMV